MQNLFILPVYVSLPMEVPCLLVETPSMSSSMKVSQQMLLKKFQISIDHALDGVLDDLNSRNLGDGGPIDALSPDD